MTAQKLWVLAPSYGDAASFRILRERIRAVLDTTELEFVVVDDTGGVDPEVQALRELDDVTVLDPPFNLGHQRAIVFGIRSIGGRIAEEDVVITLDSDGQDQPEDLPRLLAALFAGEDLRRVVLARRGKRQEPLLFAGMYRLFRILFRALTGTVVRTGNFAAYRGWTALHMLRHPYFDLSYSSTFLSLNIDIEYVRCDRGERYAGRSKMTYGRLIMHGLSMLMPFADRIAVRALIAFGVTMVTALAGAIAVLCVKVFTHSAIPGWAATLLVLLIVVSVVALGNFIVLFAVFSQSRGMALADVESVAEGAPRLLARQRPE